MTRLSRCATNSRHCSETSIRYTEAFSSLGLKYEQLDPLFHCHSERSDTRDPVRVEARVLMLRRQFLHLGAAAVATPASGDIFRFAVIADTHIIDEFYKGPEGSLEDTESIRKTTERLAATRTFLNSLKPALDRVFLVGDYFHDYPSLDIDFFFANKTRVDHAKDLTDGFKMPVHAGFGNHDYSVPRVSQP